MADFTLIVFRDQVSKGGSTLEPVARQYTFSLFASGSGNIASKLSPDPNTQFDEKTFLSNMFTTGGASSGLWGFFRKLKKEEVPLGYSRGGFLNAGTLQGRTISGGAWALIISPAPERVETQHSSDSQEQPIILSPRHAAYSRRSATKIISFSFTLDWYWSPRLIGIRDVSSMPIGWIERYIRLLESLAEPVPSMGRKLYLALRHGKEWWGAGAYALHLEDVSVARTFYEVVYAQGQREMTLTQAEVSLRFREFLLF